MIGSRITIGCGRSGNPNGVTRPEIPRNKMLRLRYVALLGVPVTRRDHGFFTNPRAIERENMAKLVINIDYRDFVFTPPPYKPPGFRKPLLGFDFRVFSQGSQRALQLGEAVKGVSVPLALSG